MLLSNRSRRGFSLTEVIVALFIMALGIISLLTLFPLGAVQMGKALRDDRSQTTAVIADGKMRLLWEHEFKTIPFVTPNPPITPPPPYPQLFEYKSLFVQNMTSPATGLAASFSNVSSGAMYPILCDPIGVFSYPGNKSIGVAATPLPATVQFKRINITGINGPNALNTAANFLTMPDDLTFDPASSHPAVEAGSIARQGRFNFAYVLQVPNYSTQSVCDMKVLVFDRRIPGINPIAPNNELTLNGTTSAIQMTTPTITAPMISAGLTQLTFNTTDLGLRSGAWLMDGTVGDPVLPDPSSLPTPRAAPIRTANFYRILSVEEVAGTTIVDLETAWKKPTADMEILSYTPTIYYFRELIDVYDRPQLSLSTFSYPAP
jgi:prepilin-type N-terminal cleavage/methylation domain-containing protein